MKLRATFFLSLALATAIQAEEGGAGHYVPGSMATIIDLLPTKPGWVIEGMYLHYDGSAGAGRTLATGGQITAGLEATSDAIMLGGLFTFKEHVLGASYSIGGFVPYVWMDATATVTAGGKTFQRNDTSDDLGDISFIPAMLAWKQGDLQYNFLLPIYAPTGGYDLGSLANPGRNHWTFDPTIGISYNGTTNGFNAALYTGFAINTENNATDYQSGTAWHTEFSVQQLLPVGKGLLGLGFNAFYYEQITADSGSGATLGSFKSRTTGIGPVLTYILPLKENTLVMEARWLPELDTDRRLEGNYIWFKAAYQF